MADYRNDARRELARAKDELGSADDERLKYSALELRMAMESLTYDRALAYKDEFPGGLNQHPVAPHSCFVRRAATGIWV